MPAKWRTEFPYNRLRNRKFAQRQEDLNNDAEQSGYNAYNDFGADGLANTNDVGEGNGLVSAGEIANNAFSGDDLIHTLDEREGKDLMIELTYGACWKFDLGIDPENNMFADLDGDGDTERFEAMETRDVNANGSMNDAGVDLNREAAGDKYGIYMWSIGYDCAVHDGLNVNASIGQDEDRFNEGANIGDRGGMTATVGMTVTF